MRQTKLFFVLVLLLLFNSVFAGRYYDAATGRWLQVDPLADNYPSWSPYNYTLNNPIKNVDPDGKAVETVLDVISVGMSAYDLYKNPSWENAGWLLADVAGAVLPFVPAAGLVRHAGKIDNVVDLVKGADKASDAKKVLKGIQNPKVKAAIEKGIQKHREYNPGKGFQKEVYLGKGNRADALKIDGDKGFIKELKPNNKRAIKKGEKQLERYKKAAKKKYPNVKEWETKVETYD